MPRRLLPLLLATALYLIAAPHVALAVDPVVSPAAYRAALGELLAAADEALSVLPGDAPLSNHPPVRQALDRLQGMGQVDMGNGALLAVDGRSLAQQMEQSRSTERLRQTIGALDAALARGAEPPNARARLDQVLARPEFGAPGKSVAARLAELRDRLARWLESIFPSIDLPEVNLGAPLRVIEWLLVAGLVLFAVAFLLFGWWSARPSLLRGSALPGARADLPEDAESARFAAERAAARGDYRLAVHHALLWALLRLAGQSRLRFDHSLTNREQLRVLSVGPALAEALPPVMDTFDRVWYGHAACGPDDYTSFRASLEHIVEAMP